jgi:metallophosphoesterase (TIGR00282 family)
MENRKLIKILFFGDMVGRPGRFAVRDWGKCNGFPDFVIANVENASHGFGLTENNYNELIEYGIDAMTSGNHIWDRKDIFAFIDKADKLVRPFNYPPQVQGVGSRVFEVNGAKIAIINLLGQIFMNTINSPFTFIDEIKRLKEITPIVIVDFHAEATAEKICFAKVCADLGVSAFFGTHTHVQTADERIIISENALACSSGSRQPTPQAPAHAMAYITDVGMCGADGVIGMDFDSSLKRFTTGVPERYEISADTNVMVNAVEVEIEPATGKAISIKRIFEVIDNGDKKNES